MSWFFELGKQAARNYVLPPVRRKRSRIFKPVPTAPDPLAAATNRQDPWRYGQKTKPKV